MAILYVCSDIHSYFEPFKKALDEAGFDPNNENHWIISCGDEWDRGTKPVEVMQYLISLPRKVLVRGNHESLLQDLCEKDIQDLMICTMALCTFGRGTNAVFGTSNNIFESAINDVKTAKRP